MRYSYNLCKSISILLGVSVAAISLGLMASPANAEDVKAETSISATPPAATKSSNTTRPAADGKKTYSLAKPYFVEIRARNAATYGHMYVLYGQVNARGEIIKSDIAGHHPAGDANDCENCSVFNWTIGHVLFVPGEMGASDGDLEEKYVTARYRVMLNAAEYKKVTVYIEKVKANPPLWNALWRDCVGFARDVAELVGLRVPGFPWLVPKDFVEQLRALNGGPVQGPLPDAPRSAKAASATSSASVPQKPKKQPVADLSPSPAVGAASATSSASVPQKPKKQPVADLSPSQAVGAASDTPH